MREFPDEVLATLRWRLSHPFKPEVVDPDPGRVRFFPKADISRNDAWDITRMWGRQRGFDDHLWRRCHTDDYWCWHVPPPKEVR